MQRTKLTKPIFDIARGFGMALLLVSQAAANWTAMSVNQLNNPAYLQATLQDFAAADKTVDEIAITPEGEWVVVAGQQVEASQAFPAFALAKINQYVAAGRKIDVVSFAPNGSWVVIAEDLRWYSGGLPNFALLHEKVEERLSAGKRVHEVAFMENGPGFVILSGSWAFLEAVPADLYRAVHDRVFSKREIQGVTVGENGRWLLYADQWYAGNNLTGGEIFQLRTWQTLRRRIDHARLGPGTSYTLYANGAFIPDANNRMEQIEYGFQSGNKNIYQRMSEWKIPGVSIAVVDGNKVVYARAYGELEKGTQRFATASSPFDTASLSKYMAAAGVMKVAEDGLLSLATDVRNLANQGGNTNPLGLWKAFGEALPAQFNINPPVPLPQGLTIRRLLSHSASLEPWSSPGFPVSSWPQGNPMTWQLLLGYVCNGGCSLGASTVWYNPALGPPGTKYRYSGGGFLAAQAAVEYVTGKSFTTVMQQKVLTPIGMPDSKYVVAPQSAAWEATAAAHHDANGNVVERAIYPWAAAGGLYASAKDYAEALIPLMNGGKTKDDAPFLQPFSVFLMLQDATPDNKTYGLGLDLSQSLVTENSGTFRHNGSHTNRAYAQMLGSPNRDQAIVVLVNRGKADDGDTVLSFVSEVLTAFQCAYGWPGVSCP